MDDAKPKMLANKVIQQLVWHMLSESQPIGARDYGAIRVVFRQCGGVWSKLLSGDHVHTELLKLIVTAWGQLPSVQQEAKRVV